MTPQEFVRRLAKNGWKIACAESCTGGLFAKTVTDVPGASDSTELTYDIGALLEFTLLPLLNVGVHAGYARVEADDGGDPLEWIPIGVNVTLVL